MRVATLHRWLFVVLLATTTAYVLTAPRRPLPHSASATAPSALAAIPSTAALIVTVDVAALRASELGASLLGAAHGAGPLGDLLADCTGDPMAGVREVAFAIPARSFAGSDAELEFGLAAVGRISAPAVADCAAAIVRRRGAEPARTEIGAFTAVRDRGGTSEGEVAVRDGGPALLSAGAFLRDMIDAAEGRTPNALAAGPAHELRTEVGEGDALVATFVAPTSTEPWADALGGAVAAELDAVRAVAVRARFAPRLEAQVRLICAEEPPCQALAESLRARLSTLGGAAARLLLGFDASRCVTITTGGPQVTLDLALEGAEARRVVELVTSNWNADDTSEVPRAH